MDLLQVQFAWNWRFREQRLVRGGVGHTGFAIVGFLCELDVDAAIHQMRDFERQTGSDFARDAKAGLNGVVVLVIGREVEHDAAVAAGTGSDTEQTEFESSYFSERQFYFHQATAPKSGNISSQISFVLAEFINDTAARLQKIILSAS